MTINMNAVPLQDLRVRQPIQMETSGGFVFICCEPLVAIHDSTLIPVILADGHPDPTQFRKA